MKLCVADTVALILGGFGYYAVAAIMVVKCECGGSDYAMAAGLFSVSSLFLLPALHQRLTAFTQRWQMRVPFVLLSMVWVFVCYTMLMRFNGMDLPLPGWTVLSNNAAYVSLAMAALIVFNYLAPGAAYDRLRDDQATKTNDDVDRFEVESKGDAPA